MLETQIITKMLRTKQGGAAVVCHHGLRWMVTKAANRAAVHGSKLPLPGIIPVEEVEMEINRAIEDKERKRRGIENIVDSQLKHWQVLYAEEIACSN